MSSILKITLVLCCIVSPFIYSLLQMRPNNIHIYKITWELDYITFCESVNASLFPLLFSSALAAYLLHHFPQFSCSTSLFVFFPFPENPGKARGKVKRESERKTATKCGICMLPQPSPPPTCT